MGTTTYGSWRNTLDEELITIRAQLLSLVQVSRSMDPAALLALVGALQERVNDLAAYLDEVRVNPEEYQR